MQEAYVGYALDKGIRATSTSGGICQCISRYVIEQGGVVSGIYFDQTFCARRGFASTLAELDRFTKSKYVQARQDGAYAEVKRLLEAAVTVLFIGTPCQVAGLRGYLGRAYANLYCIDFVCLGVPSEQMWQAYLAHIAHGRKLVSVDFKDKVSGWRNFSFHAVFSDGTELCEPGRQNAYMKAMIQKVINRPACYRCTCRTPERDADLTVADAWGTETLVPELWDDRGTSSVMVHSEQGKRLLEQIKASCRLRRVPPEALWAGNTGAWKQYGMPRARSRFYADTERFGFGYAYRRWHRSQWPQRCRQQLKRVLADIYIRTAKRR